MSVEYINKHVTLKELIADIADDHVKVFHLENVVVDGDDMDLVRFTKALRGHPGIEEFSFINVTVSNDAVHLNSIIEMLLVTVPHIHILQIEHTHALSAEALAAIGYCFPLRTLLLSNNDFKDECAATIAAAVAQNGSIEHVDMTLNDMTDVGCAAFARALEKNVHLHVLKVDGNGKISGNKMSELNCALSERAAKAA